MPFDGTKPGPGRPKGLPNKTTLAVKEALELAFHGIGGVPALIEWAKTKRGKAAFYQLWVKMLPKNIELGNIDGTPLVIQVMTGVPEAAPSLPEKTAVAKNGNGRH